MLTDSEFSFHTFVGSDPDDDYVRRHSFTGSGVETLPQKAHASPLDSIWCETEMENEIDGLKLDLEVSDAGFDPLCYALNAPLHAPSG